MLYNKLRILGAPFGHGKILPKAMLQRLMLSDIQFNKINGVQ